MHFPRVKLFTKKTKQAGPLVFELAPHHWIPTPLPSGPQPSMSSTDSLTLTASTSASSTPTFVDTTPRTRTEEDLTLREYKLFNDRAHFQHTGPIDEDDRQLGHKHGMFFIPLDMAQRLDVIKYRMEGFEMQEHREHIRAVIRGD